MVMTLPPIVDGSNASKEYHGRSGLTVTFIFLQEDGSAVSIFSITGANPQDAKLTPARNGAKRLRTVCTSSERNH